MAYTVGLKLRISDNICLISTLTTNISDNSHFISALRPLISDSSSDISSNQDLRPVHKDKEKETIHFK